MENSIIRDQVLEIRDSLNELKDELYNLIAYNKETLLINNNVICHEKLDSIISGVQNKIDEITNTIIPSLSK